MESLEVQKTNGATAPISGDALRQLETGLKGRLVTPGGDGYEESRTIWNAMISKRPALIVQPDGVVDVCTAVKFAREHELLLAVRGGGHNIAGKALCEGGLQLDFSKMRAVKVDPSARTVVVGPGATLADLDAGTQAHGLAVPVGINSTTGVAGLTLGGGFGWISRTHGLTIDNLLSAQVVTADGEVLTASASENPDLFWAIRGGGGNFGIVTSFTFQAHPVGPEVLSGLIVYPFAQARDVIRQYRELCKTATDATTVWMVARKAPPLPFLPEEVHGTDVLVLAAMYCGDMADGEKALAPFRAIGKPIADVIGPHPFAGWQQAFDPLLTPGMRNYWKSHYFETLDDGWIDALEGAIATLPSPHTEIFVGQLGGRVRGESAESSAFGDRAFNYVMNVHGRWETAAEDVACVAWCRKFFEATESYSTGGAYMNFLTEDEADRVHDVYGANEARLSEIKKKYDPTNFFRANHNIKPS